MSLEPNTVLNHRYRIIQQLGSGGMGAVYRAHDENLDVEVAVKENFFVSAESARQFQREAQLLFELRHPSLPRVIDHFVTESQGQYLVMDYIEGQDARELLENNAAPLAEAQVLRWAGEILEALRYLHGRKPPVIHRDIKPANIKVTPSGRAMLVDFGLAKEYDPAKSTTVGAKAFTPGFAPPEQYGEGRTDPRTDVYSLGATLYNLLTNQVPPDGLQRAVGTERLIPVRELNPQVSPHVAAAIERATAVKPEDRFERAQAFEAALSFAPTSVGGPAMPAARSPAAPTVVAEPREPVLRAERKRSIVPWLIGGVVVLGAGVGGVMLLVNLLSGPRSASTAGPTVVPSAAPATELPAIATLVPTSPPTELPQPTDLPQPTEPPPPTPTPTPAATPRGGGAGQVAFVSERTGSPQIFLVDADGQNLTQLTALDDGACQPAWSPDGQQLAFTSPCHEKRDQYPNAALFVMNADGSDPHLLISLVGGVFDPAWSEAGIAFTWLESGIPAIWVADASGGNHQRISLGRARDGEPSWAPANDKLAVMNTSRAGSPTVFWVFADGTFNGSNPDQVTRSQVASEPDWSPQGELIAYVASNHIWVVPWDAVGFGNVQLTERGPNDDPDWSSDGQWIVFESWREAANHDIYLMTANGGQPTRLTTDPAPDYQPAWRP
jgi:Tol biopolymer transport system component